MKIYLNKTVLRIGGIQAMEMLLMHSNILGKGAVASPIRFVKWALTSSLLSY